MVIQFFDQSVQFSNGYNKMADKNGPVLEWPVKAEINHSKTKLVWFSDVYCTIDLL
jgi:hypothetical protein